MLVSQSLSDASDALRLNAVEGQRTEECQDRPLTFVFSGQGSQYPGMAQEIYEREAIYRTNFELCAEITREKLDIDLHATVYPTSKDPDITLRTDQTLYAQPALFAVEYSLSKMLIEWGICPESMIGHSIGEYVAATLAGVFSVEEALALVCNRARLMQQTATGAMLAVSMSEEELRKCLPRNLEIAAVNASSQCVISGTEDLINGFCEDLVSREITYRKLRTSHAFHSAMMDSILEPFADIVRKAAFARPKIPFISNVTGTWITDDDARDPEYWVRHVRQTVRFAAGIAELLGEPDRLFLEVGPGATLAAPLRALRCAQRGYYLLQGPKCQSEICFLLNTLGSLWLSGVQIDWKAFHAGSVPCRIPLPTYPFQKERHWVEQRLEANIPKHATGANSPPPLAAGSQACVNPPIPGTPKTENPHLVSSLDSAIRHVGLQKETDLRTKSKSISNQLQLLKNRINSAMFIFDEQSRMRNGRIAHLPGHSSTHESRPTENIPLTPIQHWFFDQHHAEPSQFCQVTMIDIPFGGDSCLINEAVQALTSYHDALHMRFLKTPSGWRQFNAGTEPPPDPADLDLSAVPSDDHGSLIQKLAAMLQRGLDLSNGPLVRTAIVRSGARVHSLLVVIHHLVVDFLSWRILSQDFHTAYESLGSKQRISLPREITSFKEWSHLLQHHARSATLAEERSHWLSSDFRNVASIPVDYPHGANLVSSAKTIAVSLSADVSRRILQLLPALYQTKPSEALIAMLQETLTAWSGHNVLIAIEAHGRDLLFDNVNLSRTVGWFTSVYPFVLTEPTHNARLDELKNIRQRIRTVPGGGIGYGLLRYLSQHREATAALIEPAQPQVSFLYLGKGANGQLHPAFRIKDEPACPSNDSSSALQPPSATRPYLLDFAASFPHDTLSLEFTYSDTLHKYDTINTLLHTCANYLTALATTLLSADSDRTSR